MGNRAVIQFGKAAIDEPVPTGIYLHWNGGRESVQAFLDCAKQLGCGNGGDYAVARLCQIIGNFFGGTDSLGVAPVDQLDCDNGDNGVFIVDNSLQIVARLHAEGRTDAFASTPDGIEYGKGVLDECLRTNTPFFLRGLSERTVVENQAREKAVA